MPLSFDELTQLQSSDSSRVDLHFDFEGLTAVLTDEGKNKPKLGPKGGKSCSLPACEELMVGKSRFCAQHRRIIDAM
eukprot:5669730-Amphidinium_carterae.1